MSEVMIPSEMKLGLIEKAMKKFGAISFCTSSVLAKAFTVNCGQVIYWFNTPDNSTHTVSQKINVKGLKMEKHLDHKKAMSRLQAASLSEDSLKKAYEKIRARRASRINRVRKA
jgi:hypothetical protein